MRLQGTGEHGECNVHMTCVRCTFCRVMRIVKVE